MTPLTARLFDQIGLSSVVGLIGLAASSPALFFQDSIPNLADSLLNATLSVAGSIHQAIGPVWTPSVLECVLLYGLLSVAAASPGRGFRWIRRHHAAAALVFTWLVVVAADPIRLHRGEDMQVFLSTGDQIQQMQDGVFVASSSVSPWFVWAERHLAGELKRRRIRSLKGIAGSNPAQDYLRAQFFVPNPVPYSPMRPPSKAPAGSFVVRGNSVEPLR